jgi:hypothetical protein
MSLILRHAALLVTLGAGCVAGACGGKSEPRTGSPGQGSLKGAPAARTEAVLVGPLCQGDACRCRQADGDAGAAPAGSKRFEVRLGSADDPLWATIDGMVLYKAASKPDACFYVDLRPGKHLVSLRGDASSPEGLSATIAIAEQGGAADATWWYRTFDFQCGAPGQCALEELDAWKREVAALGGKHDPCGSTKVAAIRWETGRMPDSTHPAELILNLTLEVYKFTPPNPPGSDECDSNGNGKGGAAVP